METSKVEYKTRILVIDDEPQLRLTLGAILQKAGYDATLAENGALALKAMTNARFDLAFLDLKMPDFNGLDLLPQLRALDPDLPVLILTAYATLESAMEAVRGGARDYLLKPVDPTNILARVAEILAEHRPPSRRRELISQAQQLLQELQQLDGTTNVEPTSLPTPRDTEPERFLRRGKLTLDLHTKQLVIDGQITHLPPSTFDYLVTLVRNSPNIVSFEKLVRESQAYILDKVDARDISRWHIHKIRKALEEDPANPSIVITERDKGYRLVI